jgi:protein gp37
MSAAWYDYTFNAWSGCTLISPACDHCYAAGNARSFSRAFGSWDRDARAAGVGRRVFCNSMSDVFDNQCKA